MQKIEYDIYLPTVSRAGDTVDSQLLKNIRDRLIQRFGGLTDTRIANKGFWKSGGTVLRDEIVVWRVLSEEGPAGDDFLRGLKAELEKDLKEDKILIVRRAVDFL